MSETEVDKPGKESPFVQFEDVTLPKSLFSMMNKGITLEEKLKELKSIPYQDGDVIIGSYPKTGKYLDFRLYFQ